MSRGEMILKLQHHLASFDPLELPSVRDGIGGTVDELHMMACLKDGELTSCEPTKLFCGCCEALSAYSLGSPTGFLVAAEVYTPSGNGITVLPFLGEHVERSREYFESFLSLVKGAEKSSLPLETQMQWLQDLRKDRNLSVPIGVVLIVDGQNKPLNGLRAAEHPAKLLLRIFVEKGACTRLEIVYDPGLYSSKMVDDLLHHVVRHLSCTQQNPNDDIPSTIVAFNNNTRLFPNEATSAIHRALLKQCKTLPNNIAIIDGSTKITFGELFNAAQHVALELVELGVPVRSRRKATTAHFSATSNSYTVHEIS